MTHWSTASHGRPDSPEAFIAHISIDHADGSEQVLTTDASWRTHTGMWIPGGLRNDEGDLFEHIDERLEPIGWDRPGFDDRAWPRRSYSCLQSQSATTKPAAVAQSRPLVVREPDGTFVVTYQSFVHDRACGQPKLYARTTTDFTTFSAPIRLLANVLAAPTDRLIELARSTNRTLAGPWKIVGRPAIRVYGDTIENYEFLDIGGRHALLATSNNLDRPQLFQLTGNPADPNGWLHWSAIRELAVPQEAWNPGKGVTGATFEHANCAFLVGGGAQLGGFSYLVYGDSADLSTFNGAGRAQFGGARSTDLGQWSVPPR